MLRRILLGGIMLVSVLIIVVALQQLHEKQAARKRQAKKEAAALTAPGDSGIELRKYDAQNNLVAIIRGRQAQQISGKGPVDIVKPVVTIFRDKNEFTVITAETGRVESREQDKMSEGWLKDNVVMTVIDRARGDNTIITCDEIRFSGEKNQVLIPGQVKAHNRTLDLTGVSLVADQKGGTVKIERDVELVLKEVSGGSLDAAAGGSAAAPGTTPEPPKPIVITCEGAMVYESESRRTTFEREVRAVQGDNRVRSDLMTVEFEEGASPAEPVAAPTPEETPAAPKPAGLTVRRVVMTADKKEGVVVEGPNRQGWGDRFEYDARDGSLVYSGSPCRASQKSSSQTFQLEGLEIRFGRKRLVSQAEPLPAGMTENSQKVLLTGKPARVVSVPAGEGEPLALLGDRVLFDQDGRVAWLEGAPDRHAVASQGKNRIEGVEVLLIEKTATRGERASAKGPGRLETVSRARAGAAEPKPTVVEFGGDMTYRPDEAGAGGADFSGGVRFSDGVTECTSKSLGVVFGEGAKSGSREVRQVTATGDVVVKGDKMDAKADILVYGYPPGEAALTSATLTAKPGETVEVRQGDLFCKAERVDMTEVPGAGGKTGMRAKAVGTGYIKYEPAPPKAAADEPAPRADAPAPAQPFEVRFTQSGTYDDVALQSVFDGDVRMTRENMDLRGRRITLDFERKQSADASGKAQSGLSVTTITATRDVTLVEGKEPNVLTATGEQIVWDRVKQTAALCGDEQTPARVLRDRNELTAPRMDAKLKNDAIDRIVTTGGGHMIGWTQTSLGKSAKTAKAPETPETPAAPPLQKLDVTWTGEGYYEVLKPEDPAKEPTAFVRVKGNAKAVSEDSDCSADQLLVYLGPPKPVEGAPAEGATKPESGGLKLEVRKALAVDNARAKAFNPEGNYYRYARGDTLEWDRLTNRMVVSSEKGEAVVWDNSNEWVGKELIVNRTPEGRFEAESTSGRRITFYEEGTPKVPAEDGKEWKPIY